MEQKLEVANLVFKIGGKELLEVFDDWFYPVIKDARLPGRGETKEYIFHELTLSILDDGEPVLSGYLIKDMEIRAIQKLDGDKLIPSNSTLPSSPSSFFILLLKNHKLLWIKETNRAATLENFETCLERLVSNYRKDYIDAGYKEERKKLEEETGKKRFLKTSDEYKQIQAIYQKLYAESLPNIEVRSIADQRTLSEQLERFHLIKTLTLKVKDSNNEVARDNLQFLEKAKNTKSKLNAKSETIKFTNNDGLDKTQSMHLMKASGDGNFGAVAEGITEAGAPIKTDLAEVSIRAPLDQYKPASPLKEKVKVVIKKWADILNEKAIYIQDTLPEIKQRAVDIVQQHLAPDTE